jgi:hypothetical protein
MRLLDDLHHLTFVAADMDGRVGFYGDGRT